MEERREPRMSIENRKPELTCPNCGGKTRVVETRGVYGNALRRRRKCIACGERRTTREHYI